MGAYTNIAILVGQTFLGVALLISASAQLQAWALENDQVKSGLPDAPLGKSLFLWFQLTRQVVISNDNEHPDEAKFQRRASLLVSWVWLLISAMLTFILALIGLVGLIINSSAIVAGIVIFVSAIFIRGAFWFVAYPSKQSWFISALIAILGILIFGLSLV